MVEDSALPALLNPPAPNAVPPADAQRLRRIFDALPCYVAYVDREQRYRFNNRPFEQALGRPVAELYGMTLREALGPEEYERVRPIAERALAGETVSYQWEGRGRKFLATYVPDFRDGRVDGYFMLTQDVTELKRVEETLRESERAQREFTANVSHELRTPLAAIQACAETLRHAGPRHWKDALKFVGTIERHAERLSALVEQVLVLSTLDSSFALFKKEPIDLAEHCHGLSRLLGPLARKKRVQLVNACPDGIVVLGDDGCLAHVVQNLLSNALKFTPAGGWVRLSAEVRGGQAVVTVSDSGCGIPLQDLPFVFERFYRGVKTRHKTGHTGLGLHIVKRLVEGWGGRVWVESVEGRGAAFYFTLPLAGLPGPT